MNEQGVSFIETMLALSILFLITLTLLPFSYTLQQTLHERIFVYHASEVAYNGAQLVKNYGQTVGVQRIDYILYEWRFDGREICVSYTYLQKGYEQCIS